MSNSQLRRLCVVNDWFNCGTNEQYEKLLSYNEKGAFISQLAVMIWLCSDAERETCENEQ